MTRFDRWPVPLTGRNHHNYAALLPPQADAVEAAFSKFGNRELVTEGGHHEKQLAVSSSRERQVSLEAAGG